MKTQILGLNRLSLKRSIAIITTIAGLSAQAVSAKDEPAQPDKGVEGIEKLRDKGALLEEFYRQFANVLPFGMPHHGTTETQKRSADKLWKILRDPAFRAPANRFMFLTEALPIQRSRAKIKTLARILTETDYSKEAGARLSRPLATTELMTLAASGATQGDIEAAANRSLSVMERIDFEVFARMTAEFRDAIKKKSVKVHDLDEEPKADGSDRVGAEEGTKVGGDTGDTKEPPADYLDLFNNNNGIKNK